MKDRDDDKTSELPGLEPLQAKKGRGRPSVHVDAAARQKAYRERKKLEGQREVKHWVKDLRDQEKQLESSIIDLSEVRKQPKRG